MKLVLLLFFIISCNIIPGTTSVPADFTNSNGNNTNDNTGSTPTLNTSTSSIDFGIISPGLGSISQSITFTNVSGSTYTSCSVLLNDTANFKVDTNSCAGSLVSGATCIVSLIASPSNAGVHGSTVDLTCDADMISSTLTVDSSGLTPITFTLLGYSNTTTNTANPITVHFRDSGSAATPAYGYISLKAFSISGCTGAVTGMFTVAPISVSNQSSIVVNMSHNIAESIYIHSVSGEYAGTEVSSGNCSGAAIVISFL